MGGNFVGTNSSFRVCDQCHQRIPADSVFCPECGASLHPTRVSRNAGVNRSQNFSALWGLLGAGVLLVVVLVVVNRHHHASIASGPQATQASSGKTHRPSGKTTPSQSSTTPKPKAHTTVPKQPKPKIKTKTNPPPAKTKTKVPSTPPTILAGWTNESLPYHGATVSVTLPKSLTESASKISASEWLFANTGNSAYNVQVSALPASFTPPQGSTSLGPDAYGTPISKQGNVSSQTLYVDWTGHAWIAVAMAVPSKDSNWLGTIAQSVRIS